MEAHCRIDLDTAFVATAEQLSRLWSVLDDAGMRVHADAVCRDSLVRRFDSRDTLLGYENPARAAIFSLEITAASREPRYTATISFGSRYSAPISLSVQAEESLVTRLRTQLSDTLAGMKPWYSRFATLKTSNIWMPILLVSSFFFLMITPASSSKPALPVREALVVLSAILGIGLGIFVLVLGAGRLRKRFFPICTFAIGQGSTRHGLDEQIRWGIVIGSIVSVLGSLLATLLLGGIGLTTPSS